MKLVEASVVLYSLENHIITMSAAAVAALVLGFVTGEFSLVIMARSLIGNM